MRGTFPPCCASTANGVIRMPPPTMAMNARRSISLRSLDELIGSYEQRLWDGQAERLGGLEVDDELESNWSLDGKVAHPGALQDAINVIRALRKERSELRAITHEAARFGESVEYSDRR